MAANQSRRRLGPDQASDIDVTLLAKSRVKFQYQPLDPSVDYTRLVEFKPAEDANDAPRCKLVHVTFGERPKYEALSYIWGDETEKKNIFVDGKEFLVGQNLWDALQYLRKRVNGQRYWIDAICINQADNSERNRQLRIMPHIYRRANMVLVWLGKRKDARFNRKLWLMDLTAEEQYFPASELVAHHQKRRLQDAMLLDLCSDEYWGRVWIVQEIGMAQKIQVCYDEVEEAWDAFIQRIRLRCGNITDTDGPLKLERQRQNKYDGGHTFRKLLENHQDAVCKDPRDKIYGFVGLVQDARGFPMDYEKSLFEVWKDTMLFMNKDGKLSGSDVIHLANMVKRLLGGSIVGRVDQVIQKQAT